MDTGGAARMNDRPAVQLFAPASRPVVAVVGDRYTILASGEETGGAYALFDALVPPGGGPPPHSHSREDEEFFVIAGQLSFFDRGQRSLAGPGTFVRAPRHSLHGFRNEGPEPARMLIVVRPAGLERFFLEIGTRLPDAAATIPPFTEADKARLLAVAPRYGIEIAVPGPTA